MLAMENEGWPIAQWFADRGITAFIVKYRLNPTPTDEFDFQAEMNAVIAKIQNGEPMPELPTPPQAVEDGIAALRYVRLNAAEYGIDPSRIGMVGFSAGAMTSLEVIDNIPEEEQPAFIGSIYGPMKAREVPASAPPLFVVLAADDPIFGGKGFGIVEAWGDAGRPVEMHFYQQGGHGFGVGNLSLTSGDWMESFYHWLSMNGFVSSAATNP
jgi:acetyl esterase/lipase